MNALWNSLPVPALLLNRDDTIAQSNPAAEAFLNLSTKALVGSSVWDKVMIDSPLEAAYARASENRSSLFVNDVDVSSGERMPMQCNIQFAPLNEPDEKSGEQMLMIFEPREMAMRMNTSAKSVRAARSAIGMAEMLAHEIKNPLAGITGAAQLLSMTLSNEDRELTDLIVEESRRVVKLLEQVEQFGNLQPPNRQPVNLHDVLDRARQSASVGFGAHMMFLEDYDPSLPPTYADPDQLLQVLLNLLKNASQAGSAGGTITLHTFYEPSLRMQRKDGSAARLPLQIEIIDDGPGLPPDIAADVFEPFISGRENGTGLGLALVSKLIADVGGWISVDSVPGRTVFRVSLPVVPKENSGDA
ncbi:two-component system, NtrC family, nitrogen regulation sensor histidine kinase GlnL [Octadecabacter temperatus]|uniref:histidine kinase n=1 Tax=Octadecabacter temperatus TaxID=1458307 RepID=A0A0K0Y4W9_9RHOB|nr:ATP-binding protein [Octadecabacter temperatus]AKS45980.1 Nitrogen regulation protein NR(II) [Octadecabacter temperatus]SIO04902.1 two-component system, NtrC family, nitrogen regulation sensor histidine kinase GlnL [Octadecabacter temperatus]